MALSFGFYNSINADRTYDAIQFGQIFDGIIKDGIYATYEKAMVVIASENAGEVIIQPGRAWFNHTWSYNDANYIMAAPEPDVLLERIDALVLDVNTELAFRENSFVWVEGTASSRPERPTLTNTVTHHQYPLCYVHRYPETTMIYTRDITNAVGTSETPFVTGVLTGLDIDMWINQWDDEFHTWETNTRTQFEGWMINQQEVYTTWFNSVRSQMEDNMTEFEAWFETIQGIIDEEAATHLQAEIDALAEMLPAGSHIDIHTTESTLYNRNVTVSDQAGHSKTVKFGATGDATVESFPYVGLLDFVSTDGVRTASSSITTPYFGRYSVTMAFWAATCNLVSDESFAGIVVTVKDSLGDVKGAVTLDQYGSGVYTATYPDEYTFTLTYGGRTMEVSLAVTQETTYEVELHGGFRFDIWLETGRVSETFDTLDEVLADEATLRQLFLVHDSVDYICDTFVGSGSLALADITKIFNTDLAAKWINLSDYALDHFYAVSGIKSIMDAADKYGYGEWGINKPLIPVMTSATAPSGTCFSYPGDASNSEKWKAFDGNEGTRWASSGETAGAAYYVGYDFDGVKTVYGYRVVLYTNVAASNTVTAKIQYSSDNSTWTDAATVSATFSGSTGITCPKSGKFDVPITARYFRVIRTAGPDRFAISEFQLYEWGPKGNVPVMISASAPYGTVICHTSSTVSGYEPYKIFDGNDSTIGVFSKVANGYLGYKFTNPIMPKKCVVISNTIGVTWIVQGSNDNSTWEDISEPFTLSTAGEKVSIDLTANKSYLYLIVKATNLGSGDSNYGFRTLQFYGRELKVSVPTMTSNTAPYGVAIKSGETSSQPAYYAFDNSASTHWRSGNNTTNNYVGYAFLSSVCVKMVTATFHSAYSNLEKTFTIQASNDGFVSDVNDLGTIVKTATASNSAVVSINNDEAYLSYRIFCPEILFYGSSWAQEVTDLQFYGLDYSEKEFEAGTTKKWLYDHGVELVEPEMRIGSGVRNSYSKEDSQVYLLDGTASSNNATYAKIAWNIGLTSYSLIRCAIGNRMTIPGAGGGSIAVGASGYFPTNGSQNSSLRTAYSNFLNGQADLPDVHGALDVSSISSDYIFFGPEYAASNYMTLTELWLE